MNNQRVVRRLDGDARASWRSPTPSAAGWSSPPRRRTRTPCASEIAGCLGLSELDMRVIAPEVGGGFGVKICVYQEEMICAALALRLKRPIKWIETRSEHLAATHHGRGHQAEVSLAAKRDGTITAMQAAPARRPGRVPARGAASRCSAPG